MAENASRLSPGAHRTAELLPADRVVTVPAASDGTQILDGVRGRDVLVRNLRLAAELHAAIDDFVITVGGDCGVDVAPISAARRRYGERLTVLWLDAHPDVYGPDDLASGAFHGMVVRTLLGDGPAALTPTHPLTPDQFVLAGVRAGDASERAYLRRAGLRVHDVDQLEDAFDGLTGPTYVHLDLDVLDPTEFASIGYPEPDGVAASQLADLISRLGNIVGAAITEHAPAADDPDEAEVIRRLGTALCR
ncbi:arginase family protein [Solicola gregarius]|uniref:Arginase family protein n=1 Tax=Solicola gregarius TaxID=2908642 RepID=A0AA46YLI7_9ACTN|nr:arginase family protein [Solicola gregarius]UYM05624.1 arginase family protein [Solicola gregarius]